MSDHSKIEWTDATWNPVTGCTKVSAGCDHCYAETFAERWRGIEGHHFEAGFDVTLRSSRLNDPLRWRKPRRIFVNSMSDLFQADVPDGFVGDVWNTMALADRHTYQILTKRPVRARALLTKWAEADWTWRRTDMMWCGPVKGPLEHVQIGVSVEDQHWADLRIPELLRTPAAVRFLSCEPLLGPLDLGRYLRCSEHEDCGCTNAVDWVIVGGESGPGARSMDVGWVRDIRDQCADAGVPLFVKQLGTVWAKANRASSRKGADPAEWPEDLRVQQMPATRATAAVA